MALSRSLSVCSIFPRGPNGLPQADCVNEHLAYVLYPPDNSTVYEINRQPVDEGDGFADCAWTKYSLTGNNRHLRVTRGGEIIRWRFNSSQAGSASFQVWRPRPDLGPKQ